MSINKLTLLTGGLALMGMNLAAETEKPNVLFILIDDFGQHQMGCYGSTYYETPNFDKIASEGMRFTNAYAAAALSSPTRAALMSGKYPARLHLTDWLNGNAVPLSSNLDIPNWTKGLPASELSLPQKMKAAGYRTSLIGKWHVSSNLDGWDEVLRYDGPKSSSGCTGGEDCHRVKEYTDSTLNFLRRNKNQPFFCYLSHNAIHTKETEEAGLIAKYAAKPGSMDRGQLSPTQGAMVETLDYYTGVLLDSLDNMGLSENTLVIVYADNGQFAPLQERGPSPLRGYKCSFWEGGFREPLLVRWKGKITAGSLCNTPVMTQDFLPTLAEICGIDISDLQDIDGKSFAANLLEDVDAAIDRPYLCWHYPHYHPNGQFMGAIRKGDWKLIENFNQSLYFKKHGAFELYNLKDDPAESDDLINTELDKAIELYQDLKQWRSEMHAQMPVLRQKSYGMERFKVFNENEPVNVEFFDSQSGLDNWLQFDGSGTFLSFNNDQYLNYYFRITSEGVYQAKFLVNNAKQNSRFTLAGLSSANLDIPIPVSSTWSAIQSDEIHLLPGVYELNIHYTGSGIDVDKFTITNQHIPLVHDGEISGDQMKISFEDMHDVNAMISSNVQDAAYISDLNFINADNQGLNTSNRCAYFKGNSKKPLWWHGFDFTFTEPIEAPNNSYLHVLLKKSMAESQRVQITLVNLSGQQSDPLFNDPISTEWVDYVMPIPEMHKTFNRLYVKFNAQSPDTECFADEFLLTDDPAPRTALASRLDAMVTPRGMITVSNRDIRIDTNETSHIKLFNASGRQLGATHASTLHYTVSQPGLYIVHADGKSEKVLVYK